MKYQSCLVLLSLVVTLDSCFSGGGVVTQGQSCKFRSAPLVRPDSGGFASVESILDTSRSYVYETQQVGFDSLLTALCDGGFAVQAGYYVTEYLCKDAIGPRPIVVLVKANAMMLNTGFHQLGTGLGGRFGCAQGLDRYTPSQ